MRYAIVGRGRMGGAVDREAASRGHHRVAELDSSSAEVLRGGKVDAADLGSPDVAFEFTLPEAAEANVRALLRAGVPVVCGTTGWTVSDAVREAVEGSGIAAVVAPNFSIGMELFSRLATEAARWLARADLHRPCLLEVHHAGKQDAPSGTARRLARLILEADHRLARVVEGNPEGPLPEDALHVASLRAGREPGTHTVRFDGEFDTITLTHRAGGRRGFALGAVLAAEWLQGRRGLHDFGEVVDDLIAPAGAD